MTEKKCPICGASAAHGIDYCLIHRLCDPRPNLNDQSNMLSPNRSEGERSLASRMYADAMSLRKNRY
jgi:hypothetical protein